MVLRTLSEECNLGHLPLPVHLQLRVYKDEVTSCKLYLLHFCSQTDWCGTLKAVSTLLDYC